MTKVNAWSDWLTKSWRTQPRVPAGSPRGGEWLGRGSAAGFTPLGGVAGLSREQRIADAERGGTISTPASQKEIEQLRQNPNSVLRVPPLRDETEIVPERIKPGTRYVSPPRPATGVRDGSTFHEKPTLGRDEARVQLDKLATQQHASLSAKELATLQKATTQYTGRGYTQINKSLRNGETPKPPVDEFVRLVNKSKLPEDAVVFRGVMGPLADQLRHAKVGAVFSDKGFISTSPNHRQSEIFSQGGNGLVMTIKARKGSSALAVHSRHHANPEQEMIFAPGTKFRIAGIKIDPVAARDEIHLEVV